MLYNMSDLSNLDVFLTQCGAQKYADAFRAFVTYVDGLEKDSKRFESAYLELRDKLPPQLPLTASSVDSTVTDLRFGTSRIRLWYDNGSLLRVDVLPRDPIKEEAHNLAALHSLQGIPVDAIERVLREVRK